MKNLLITGFCILISQSLFAQRISDPGYAAGNYKHPNKAAYARLHNLDRQTVLQNVIVERNDNYKQPYNKVVVKSASIKSAKPGKPRASYKHPQGL